MAGEPIHIVDVFAQAPYEGNPLAVVLDADGLSSDAMQAVAREMDYSETTFVAGGDGAGTAAGSASARVWDVRIFTPSRELPFAGHPTLGTAWVIRSEKLGGAADEVSLALGVGRVPVRFETLPGGRDRAWLTAPPVRLERALDGAALAAALGLPPADLHPDAPVQRVSAGVEFVFVPLAHPDAVGAARLDPAALGLLRDQGLPPSVYCFACPAGSGPDGHDVRARLFFDANGVREDPATGSATACLGAYLLEHPLLGPGPLDLRVGQGIEMGRPSLLHLRARADARAAGGAVVEVGGGVHPIVRGELVAR